MLSINNELKANVLSALKATAIVAPSKDCRSYLNGVLLEIQGMDARFTSTDGHRLLTCRVDGCIISSKMDDIDTFSMIIPTDRVASLVDAIKTPLASLDLDAGTEDKEPVLRVIVNDECILAIHGVPGTFPNYRSVIDIPTGKEHRDGINPAYLADAKAIAKEFAKATKKKDLGIALYQHGQNFYITFDCFNAVYLVVGIARFTPFDSLENIINEVKRF